LGINEEKISMLYAFDGNQERARTKMRTTLDALMKRAPLANVMRITHEEIEGVSIDELLASQGLFYNKRIVVFDNALTNKDLRKKIAKKFKEMANSPHVFLILEEKSDTEFVSELKKHATKRETVGVEEKKEKKGADFSALAIPVDIKSSALTAVKKTTACVFLLLMFLLTAISNTNNYRTLSIIPVLGSTRNCVCYIIQNCGRCGGTPDS